MKSYRKNALRALPVFLCALFLILCMSTQAAAQNDEADDYIIPTLGLEQGFLDFETPSFRLKIVKASQTIAALQPKGGNGFDFTPADWLERRNGDAYYHLGDLTLRLRAGKTGEWTRYSTADKRAPVKALESSSYLAGALLNPTLAKDIPLQVRRYWQVKDGHLVLRFELENTGNEVVEVGGLGIPMLTEYRENPEDYHLLRVGYGGLMGSIANVTQDGFGPAAFHSFPSTLAIDGYSGDYGSGFFGHAVNTGTYVIDHPEFGWLTFGGNLVSTENWITIEPLSTARSRFYLAPMGLWLTLDADKFDEVRFNLDTKEVQLVLEEENEFTKEARLRINQPAKKGRLGTFEPQKEWKQERGAFVIPLGKENNKVQLVSN